MSGELRAFTGRPGRTAYFIVFDRTSNVWNGSAFATYATGNYSSYPVSATEIGINLGGYKATFPSAISAGVYDVIMKEQVGGSPAEGDPIVAQQNGLQWNGTATLPLSDLATSGQISNALPIRISRGQAVSGFQVYLKSAADHITPFTSGVLSGQISRDGGSFGALQSGAFSEIGLGLYKVNLTSGDLNAGVVSMVFTARGVSGGAADPLPYFFVMQPAISG